MRSLALFLLTALAFAGRTPGADCYLSPTGDDKAEGTIENPFATLQRAQLAAAPGDTVFIRGGVYVMQEARIPIRPGIYSPIIVLDKSGAPGRPITYRAYQDEKPVFNCSNVKPEGYRIAAFQVTGSWLHLQGLEVTGVQVTIKGHTQSICFESNGSHNVFERLLMHDGQAIGIYHVRGSDNLFLNCDAWNNWDYTSEDGKGGNVDGFGCHPTKGSTGNVFRGCRAWFNSDDGYDCIGAAEPVTFENCGAFYNGLSPEFAPLCDGNGFKAGGYGTAPADRLPDPIPRHIVRFCVAAGNLSSGFYSNHHPGGSDWSNNTSYRNGTNFNMLCRLADNRTDVAGYGHKLFNNLGYKSRRELSQINFSECELANNTFPDGPKLSDEDFVSLDEGELFRPRQGNGDLPAVDFLRPVKGRRLIDGGVNTGLPYKGANPDIGACEQ